MLLLLRLHGVGDGTGRHPAGGVVGGCIRVARGQ